MESNKQKLKRWRKAFDEGCRKRDGHRCVMCGRAGVKLSVHHITDRKEMPNDGYSESNGITLCDDLQSDGQPSCHMKAEEYHISKGERHIEGFHPNDLYQKVGSSYEQAHRDSTNLS